MTQPQFSLTPQVNTDQDSNLVQDRRKLKRITSLTRLGLKVVLQDQNKNKIQTELKNLTTEGLLLQIKTVRFLNLEAIQSSLKVIQILSGTKTVALISKFKVVRFEADRGTIAIQISHLNEERSKRNQSRKEIRLEPKPNFIPILMCKDPLHPRETLHFRVSNLSITGLELITSLANHHLLPGLCLNEVQILLPGIGFLQCSLILRRANTKNQELYFGAEFVNPSKSFIESLAQFCLFGVAVTHADTHMHQLNLAKFPSKKIIKGVKFGLVEEMSDYRRILNVRYLAYKDANKLDANATQKDMADSYDTDALLLYARIGEKFIATARISRSESVQNPFSFEKLFPGIEVSQELRASACELTRIAILPEHQGTDLLIGLFGFLGEVAFRNGVTQLVGYATSYLEPLYLRLGAKRLSGTIPHPVQKGETLRVILIDLKGALQAKNMTILTWEIVVKDIILNLIELGYLKKPPNIFLYSFRRQFERMILWFYKKIGKKIKI